MTEEGKTPTDQEMASWITLLDSLCGHGGETVARWHRWLAVHDEAVREALAKEVEDRPEPHYVSRMRARDRRAWRRSKQSAVDFIRDTA